MSNTSTSYIISARANDEAALLKDRVLAGGEEVKCTAMPVPQVGRERSCARALCGDTILF